MFEASVDGEAFDMERWGQYFKPAGMNQVTGDPVPKVSPPANPQTSPDLDDDPPFDTATTSSPKKDTSTSLAKKVLRQEHKLYPTAIKKIFN